MPDITMCTNSTCPRRDWCYRAMAKPSPYWQSYSMFEYKDGCGFFLPTTGEVPVKF